MEKDVQDLRTNIQKRLDDEHYRSVVMMMERYFGSDKVRDMLQQRSIIYGKELLQRLKAYLKTSTSPLGFSFELKNEMTVNRIQAVQKNEKAYYHCPISDNDFIKTEGGFQATDLVRPDDFLRIFDVLARTKEGTLTTPHLKQAVHDYMQAHRPQRATDIISDRYGKAFENELVAKGFDSLDDTLKTMLEDVQNLTDHWTTATVDIERLHPLLHSIETVKQDGSPYWNFSKYDHHLEPIDTSTLYDIIDDLAES